MTPGIALVASLSAMLRGRFAAPAGRARRGAVTVEYALVMLIAAAILMGVESEIFRPMAKDILKNFMEFIVKPDP